MSTTETDIIYAQREETYDGMRTAFIMTSILGILWVAVGLAAFVMSLICFGRSGTTAQHVIGILLAIFFGPFYWIYYFAVSNYCRKNSISPRRARK
jgi:hypothetical protein